MDKSEEKICSGWFSFFGFGGVNRDGNIHDSAGRSPKLGGGNNAPRTDLRRPRGGTPMDPGHNTIHVEAITGPRSVPLQGWGTNREIGGKEFGAEGAAPLSLYHSSLAAASEATTPRPKLGRRRLSPGDTMIG
eukprot:CAMPEP_0194390216 /NCGR_PEP_ID=MMETSP0174-20130528/108725_1 /TAXON_ID=216777 /ORGANISM="Proboscia alata, Strain PI-D3" /LENGTH=132 /DNA_ID=CAMNT_0039183331 /DNA_START=64 /DNA_END=459 /DNA_ORIENTATION=-